MSPVFVVCISMWGWCIVCVCLCVCVGGGCSRLLSVLCCNLDSLLLLEAQYGLSTLLLLNQAEDVTEHSDARG